MIDAGAGDGHEVLGLARRNARTLAIAVEPAASSLRDAARRAAARPPRGGCPNAIFVVSAVEAWPDEARGLADLVTVHYPWGSLLRGVVGADRLVLDGLARMLAPGGRLEALFSIVERDGVDLPCAEVIREAYRNAGLKLIEHRPATSEEIAAAPSTWARRLGAGRARQVWRIVAVLDSTA